jgi:RNA polymerase sigma-70 factor (sigma-E family)
VNVDASHQAEFREFVAARGAALFRVAHGLTGSQHAAEDLLQAALERAVTRWRHIDDPEAYVRRALYNEYTSWRRRAARRPERLMPAPPDRAAAGDESAAADLRAAMNAAIDRLPPRQRAVLVLRYLDDVSENDVARLLGCSPSTVSSQLARALARLRETYPAMTKDTEEVRPR